MMARGVVVAALLALLGGCTTTSREIYLPTGAKGFDIRCDGIGNRIENCFQKAGDLCGAKGYDQVNPPGAYTGLNSLFVKCKE